MKITLLNFWDRLNGSFWFVPMVMASGAIALSYGTIALDGATTGPWLKAQSWVYTGSAEGASAVLGTIASSMITIAGVVFSMTLVTLSLASSQLGPRLLRSFMTDKATQAVLGTFVATFLYSLFVLRAIRRVEENLFVPQLSVTFGVLFAVASLGVLVYFIHHVAVSIQADNVIARVGAELAERIDNVFPETVGPNAHADAIPPDAFARDSFPIGATEDGYVQLIDDDALFALAVEDDLILRVERRAGHFVVKGSTLALVWPGSRVQDRVKAKITAAFVVGAQRTPIHDAEFIVNQLVEIAVRALSPGINDPFTAVACIDRLGAALSRLAQREMPASCRHDRDGKARVITPAMTFTDFADAALNQVRQYGRSSAAVTIRLLEMIAVVAESARRPDDRAALRRHAEMIARGAQEGLPEQEDRAAVETRFQTAMRALDSQSTARA